MGSEPEKKDKKPKLKATDIYYWACEFCAFECDKDTQLKSHIGNVQFFNFPSFETSNIFHRKKLSNCLDFCATKCKHSFTTFSMILSFRKNASN